MNQNELRHCLHTSFGPRPTQADDLAVQLMAFCWPGGSGDRADVHVLSHRLGAELAVLPLPTCTCPTGHCRLCN